MHFSERSCILSIVVTLIAMKREVAATEMAGFSVERMSSLKTDDKSLYKFRRPSRDGVCGKKSKDTHGDVYSRRLSYCLKSTNRRRLFFMANQVMRITLKAYDHQLVDASAAKIIETVKKERSNGKRTGSTSN